MLRRASTISRPGLSALRAYSTLPPSNSKLFAVSEEVRSALHARKPVVALESTIYTHGFPYPDNIALASHLESVVRLNGGTPATIGVLSGQARVGLTTDEIIELAGAAGKEGTMKVSRRDLAFITGLGLSGRGIHGGTTVSGTMILAQKAGIRVFGTGGLGGVHRGGQDTMDISADLTELGRTNVAVVSSGCKSFLDIPRTLEYLETQGVCVSTFADGRSGSIDLPAFWTRDSGMKSPTVVWNEAEAAAIIYAQESLQIKSGLLFANPIPEEFSIPLAEINIAIDEAIREAAEKGYTGHSNTPFILAKIKELTGGKSIPANRALIESNVARATKVAVELAKLDREQESSKKIHTTHMPAPVKLLSSALEKADIIVLGSIAIDLTCDHAPLTANSAAPALATSNPAAIRQSIGGVGHNVASAAHLIGSKHVRLCSLIGPDLAGETILASLNSRGLDTSGIQVSKKDGSRTAQYVAVNDQNKDLVVAMADMSILDDAAELQESLQGMSPSCLVVDANWSASSIRQFFTAGKTTKARTVFEPVSTAKSTRLFPLGKSLPTFPHHLVDVATPNNYELASMHLEARSNGYLESKEWFQVIDAMGIPNSGARDRFVALTSRDMADQGIPQQSIQLLPFIPTVLTKLGKDGVLLTTLLTPEDERLKDPEHAKWILSRNTGGEVVGGVYMRLFPAHKVTEEIASVNGVGDTFLGAIVAGLTEGKKLNGGLIELAQRAAVKTLMSKEAVGDIAELKEDLKSL